MIVEVIQLQQQNHCHVLLFANVYGVFPKWKRNSLNSANLIYHRSMNCGKFKHPVSLMCLADTGSILVSYTGSGSVPGSNLFTVMTNILSIQWIQWKHLGKTRITVQLGFCLLCLIRLINVIFSSLFRI